MIKGENGVTAMTVKSKKVYKWLLSLGGERATDSYEIRQFVVKRSGADHHKIIHPDVYHRAITV